MIHADGLNPSGKSMSSTSASGMTPAMAEEVVEDWSIIDVGATRIPTWNFQSRFRLESELNIDKIK